MNKKNYQTFEEYQADFPKDVVDILSQIQKTIASVSPLAVPCIAYNMPAFKLHKKPLVYFAAHKYHIGFYALPSGNEAFQKKLCHYKTGKGSIQFPMNEDIPYDLIRQITEFRVSEMNEAILNKR